MKYNLHTLDNGLRIVLAKSKDASTASFVIMTGTGSRYESKDENGLAHFLEHMFFKGTPKRPDAKSISKELDSIGGVYNAFTAKDRTAYYAKVSNEHLDVAIDVISDIFLNSKLPQKEIDKERGAIIQEINMYEDMPMHSIDDILDASMFSKGSALSRKILGPKKNIRSFSRTDFKKYLARNYNSSNTVISVAGNFNEKKVLDTIKRTFKKINTGVAPEYEPAKFAKQDIPKVTIKHKETEQTQVMLGVPAYEYGHPDSYAQMMLVAILSGGMSSRLFTEVREKRGLAYSVKAWSERYTDTAYIAIQAGIEHKNLTQTTKVVIDVLSKLKRTALNEGELLKAKNYILGHKAIESEQTDSVATSAATQIINLGKVTTEPELRRGLSKVSSSDIRRVARDLFISNKLTLAVIGPHKNTPRLLEALKSL